MSRLLFSQFDGNTAAGKYNYTNIIARLKDLKSRIDRETEEWKEKGKGTKNCASAHFTSRFESS